jgi:hypothetical protein
MISHLSDNNTQLEKFAKIGRIRLHTELPHENFMDEHGRIHIENGNDSIRFFAMDGLGTIVELTDPSWNVGMAVAEDAITWIEPEGLHDRPLTIKEILDRDGFEHFCPDITRIITRAHYRDWALDIANLRQWAWDLR